MKRDDDQLPPGVFRDDRGDQRSPAGDGEAPLKPDAKDFLAMVIAVYQLLLPLLAGLVLALIVVYLLLGLLARHG